jgi:pimeloyl-ACP methyl ester carboxylesterase
VVRQPGATATVLLFGGFLGGLSYMHDRYLDAVLARFPVHVIYLRDPYGRAYLQGIPELGPDEAAMRQALARVVAELGGQRLVTLGGSASGYAALRTGLALGADRVLSLAGFAAPGRAEVGDPAHGVQGLRELFPGDPAEHDLRPALKGQTRTRLTQVIGGAYRPDVLRARDLDGIASAELIVIPGVDTHHVALPAITDGTFGRLMESALTG